MMAAINLCALSQQKVSFKAAQDGSLSMLGAVLTEKHGGRIAGVPGTLTPQQILGISLANSVLASNRICGTKLPPDWRKEYDRLLAEIRKESQGNSKPAP